MVRAMRASGCCQDVAPLWSSVHVRWLLAALWVNTPCSPSAVFPPLSWWPRVALGRARLDQVSGAPIVLQARSRQPVI